MDAATVTYQDADGDGVVVKPSKPVLTAANAEAVFAFDAGTVNGSNGTPQQLRAINLAALGGTSAVGDGFGFAAQRVGSLSLGGAAVPLRAGPANDALTFGTTLDVRLREV